MSGSKRPPKHWHFWRAGFWTRPGLIVAYSVLAGLVGLVLVASVPGNVADARAMLDAPECTDPDQAGCLRRIRAETEGPFFRRGPGSEWHFSDVESGRPLGEADLSTLDSRKLEDGDPVDVLFWKRTIVLVETDEGDRIETEAYGHGAWIVPLGLGLFAIGGAVVGVQAARVKRAGASSWWATSSETSGAFLPPSRVTFAAAVVMFGGVSAPLAMAFGLAALSAAILGIGVTAGLAALVTWGVRRRRDRS